MVGADGTQNPEPPKPFSDPLSGGTREERTPAQGIPAGAAQPVGMDREAVQKLVDAEMAAESGASVGSGETQFDEQAAEAPPRSGMVRASKPALLPPILRLRRKPGDRPRSRRPAPHVRKPSSGSAGLAVALVLMVIFILIAIQFVVSFVESVTSIFG
ncbi:hypothetical protein [Saccharomonospora sp.]|uniref:hypothetical protein n=1 Tax=Saccharomonospora sp. TaxID=33913 RepID=UPI002627A548|nr:hypothetical protein [Saccharomonospora sp.]